MDVYNDPGHSDIVQIEADFPPETDQLTDWQTYKQFQFPSSNCLGLGEFKIYFGKNIPYSLR